MSACVDAVRLRLSDAQSAAAVQAVLVAGNHLQPQHVPALAEQLGKFPALKQLDASSNPRLRLLPVGVLQMATSLEAFSCQGCSLVLPPQRFFSCVPEENPMRIRQLLQSGSSDTQLTLSSLDLTAAVAREVAALLRHYPSLKQLDVSSNPRLGCGGAAADLSALSGMLRSGALSSCALMFKVTPMCRGWSGWSWDCEFVRSRA